MGSWQGSGFVGGKASRRYQHGCFINTFFTNAGSTLLMRTLLARDVSPLALLLLLQIALFVIASLRNSVLPMMLLS